MNICVLGAGSWGTALARLLHKNGHRVQVWDWQADHAAAVMADGENKTFLPGIALSREISFFSDISGCKDARLVVFAVPSPVVKSVAAQAAPYIAGDAIIVNVAKGFFPEGGKRLSEVLRAELPGRSCITLSGPSHAEEVGRDMPTAVVVAGENVDILNQVQDVFMNDCFRVYTNDDLIGVEVGGAIKNIIALGSGILAGLGMGDNAKAALITRGIAEISRLGIAMGAKQETFLGLSGIGDLVVTCTSIHSRNYRAGLMIGQGRKWREVVGEMEMVVEGVFAAECAHDLSHQYNVTMPIADSIYDILYRDVPPKDAMHSLMTRPKKVEHN